MCANLFFIRLLLSNIVHKINTVSYIPKELFHKYYSIAFAILPGIAGGLALELIDKLLEQKISIIGIDFAGVRRGKEHIPKDQYCADKGVFIVENLCNLGKILRNEKQNYFIANTYPINFSDMTGLPCRVIGEI